MSKKSTASAIESTLKKAIVPALGVMAVGLVIRYGGDLPIIEDVKKGLNGDVKGKIFG